MPLVDEATGHLVAVDLGLRCGIAVFRRDTGALIAYRSTHFPSRTALKKAIRGILVDASPVAELVLEGDAGLAELWRREASKRPERPSVKVVAAHDWRPGTLLQRHQRNSRDAKRFAERKAREIIAAGEAPKPTSLRHDAAEAICLGAWAIAQHGRCSTPQTRQ